METIQKSAVTKNHLFLIWVLRFTAALLIFIGITVPAQTIYIGKYIKTTIKSQDVYYPNPFPVFLQSPKDTVLPDNANLQIPFSVNFFGATFIGTVELDFQKATPAGAWDNSTSQTNFANPILLPVKLTGVLTLPPDSASTHYLYDISINSPYSLYEAICPSVTASAKNDDAAPGSYNISLNAMCPISILGPISYYSRTTSWYYCDFRSAVNFSLAKYYSTYSTRFTTSLTSQYYFEKPKKPYLSVSPSSIELETITGDSARTKVLTVSNVGTDTLDFNASVATKNGAGWLTINTNSGNVIKGSSVNLFLKLTPGKLVDTTYSGSVTFTSIKGDNSPLVIPVKMTLSSNRLSLKFDPPDIKLGEWTTLNISCVDKYGKLLDSFDGGVTVNLLSDTKEGLTNFPKTQSVLISKGKAQPLYIFTPDKTKPFDTVITNTTVLSGPVVIEVKPENLLLKPDTAQIIIKAPIDFYIDKIEVQQGVANSDKEVTLEYKPGVNKTYPARSFVAGHNTVIRAFVKYNKTTDINFNRIEYKIKGKLNITGGNKSQGPFSMGWPGITDNPNPVTLKDTFNLSAQAAMRDALFRYLDHNTFQPSGTYSLQAELEYVSDFDEKESEKENNKKLIDVPFQDSRNLAILSTSGRLEGENFLTVNNSIWDFLKNVYPLNNSRLFVTDHNTNRYTFASGILYFTINFWNSLNEILNRYNQMAQPADRCELLIMFATPKLFLKFSGDPAAGIATIGGKVCLVNIDNPAGSTAAHELGHLLGLKDTYDPYKVYNPVAAFFASGDPNPRRQDADFTGNKIEMGNINWLRLKKATSESVFYDFMGRSQSDSAWIDRVTWDYLYKKFILSSAAKPSASGYIAVSGILKEKDSLLLNNLIKMDAVPVTDDKLSGSYSVEFYNSSGALLQKNNFELLFFISELYKTGEVPFNLYLPLPAGTAKIQIARTDTLGVKKILASRVFSANAPLVKLLAPAVKDTIVNTCLIKWSASDADKDKLTYDLSYSPDGLKEYIIAVGLQDTVYQWNVDKFPVSRNGYISIIASDGYNEGKDKSAPLIITDVINTKSGNNTSPTDFKLEQCYPNPFNPSTVINYTLPYECRISLTVYNALGQVVSELENSTKPAGSYSVVFNAGNISSGIYFYSLKAGAVNGQSSFSKNMKMILVR